MPPIVEQTFERLEVGDVRIIRRLTHPRDTLAPPTIRAHVRTCSRSRHRPAGGAARLCAGVQVVHEARVARDTPRNRVKKNGYTRGYTWRGTYGGGFESVEPTAQCVISQAIEKPLVRQSKTPAM